MKAPAADKRVNGTNPGRGWLFPRRSRCPMFPIGNDAVDAPSAESASPRIAPSGFGFATLVIALALPGNVLELGFIAAPLPFALSGADD